KVIGVGSLGYVFANLYAPTTTVIAVKGIFGHNRVTLEVSQRELHVIVGHSHPNLVRVFCEFEFGRPLVYADRCPDYRRTNSDYMGYMEVAAVTDQVLQGFDYLHSKSIVHLDIKGTNLLISMEGCVKIGELGSARPL
ncbi:kinase-like domain-containing protein, partial [Armillaria borealis]